jgi:MucB/RseB N-terminal domain
MKKLNQLLRLISLSGFILLFSIPNQLSFNSDNQTKIKSHVNAESSQTHAELLSSKTELQEKMLNSIHHFNNAKGSFVYASNDVGFHYSIDYHVKLNNSIKVKVNVKNAKGTTETFLSDEEATEIDHKSKQYMSKKMGTKLSKGNELKIKDAIKTNASGQKEYTYPDTNINLGMASNSLQSSEIALGFLEDHILWEISGTETFLDRNVTVIEGNLSDFYKYKLNAEDFKIWMDTQTGILLKFETYDKDHNKVDYLETTKIKIDSVDLNSSKVTKSDLNGFKKFN